MKTWRQPEREAWQRKGESNRRQINQQPKLRRSGDRQTGLQPDRKPLRALAGCRGCISSTIPRSILASLIEPFSELESLDLLLPSGVFRRNLLVEKGLLGIRDIGLKMLYLRLKSRFFLAAAEATETAKCEHILFFKSPRSADEEGQEAINHHWVEELKYPAYVRVDVAKVKSKFRRLLTVWKEHCSSAREMGTSSGFNIFDKYSTEFNSLFNDNEAKSSNSVGVSTQKKKKRCTVPFDLHSALKYMNEHGCDSVDFFKYTTALENTTVLRGFLVMSTYEERKSYLTDLLERGVVKTPSCELATTPSCPSCELAPPEDVLLQKTDNLGGELGDRP